jgi:hypothetical protein
VFYAANGRFFEYKKFVTTKQKKKKKKKKKKDRRRKSSAKDASCLLRSSRIGVKIAASRLLKP